jgi:hypothetical protein
VLPQAPAEPCGQGCSAAPGRTVLSAKADPIADPHGHRPGGWEKIEGCIEWYDRNALKIRGRQKILIYKSAIKYLYKLGDAGR